jgi:hypothetical protein
LQLFRRLHSCYLFAALSNEWLDRDGDRGDDRVLGGMNGCATSDQEALSGAKSFETPIVEIQGVDKGLKSYCWLFSATPGALKKFLPWRSRPIASPHEAARWGSGHKWWEAYDIHTYITELQGSIVMFCTRIRPRP